MNPILRPFRSILQLWKSCSIRTKLTALLLIGGLLPTLFFSFYIYSYSHKLLVQKELETMEITNKSVTSSFSNMLQQMENGIQEVLSFAPVQELLLSDDQAPSAEWFYQTKQVERILKNMTNSDQLSYGITIVCANGSLCNNGVHTSLYERMDGELAQSTQKQRWKILLRKRIADDGTEVMTMGKSIKYGNEARGVLLIDMPVSKANAFFAAEDAEYLNAFCLYEGEELFYSMNNTVSDAFLLKNKEKILMSNGEFISVNGESHLCTVTDFGTDYTLVLMVPSSELFAGSHQYLIYGVIIGLAAVMQGVFYSWLIARLFTRRIKRLHEDVRQFGENATPIPAPLEKGGDEISQLRSECAKMSDQITVMIHQLKENGREHTRLELAALRSQFNPHMLYNTLNTISYLAQIQEVTNIQEVSEAFSRLMRNLSYNDAEFISIADERAMIADYIAIKKYNLLNEIIWCFDIEAGLEDKPMMKLLLQPFVENAIVHGFSNMVRRAKLNISVFSRDGWIYIRIADNGHGIDPEKRRRILEDTGNPVKSDHIGISNTVRRLALTYDFQYAFDIQSEPERYTIIELAYPDRTGESIC